MPIPLCAPLSRRLFLASSSAALALAATPGLAGSVAEFALAAAPGKAHLVPSQPNKTEVWTYNQALPGPEIRVRQGDQLRVVVKNFLNEYTTVHWHGLRVPNAMDGVPGLTQAPIAPGGAFAYQFAALDAGTFWYHPHQRSFEQVGRGLYGPLIIEERKPPKVDRDVTWTLDDWRLTRDGQINDDFGNRHDMSHNGRVGNAVTINGRQMKQFVARRNERIRLRLINAANARIFSLDFNGHDPWIIALDGQPVTPHRPASNQIVLGPAMRADLLLDMTGDANRRYSVVDRFYTGLEYTLVEVAYDDPPLRARPPDWSIEPLPSNPVAEPNMAQAQRHKIIFNGGMMGGGYMAKFGGSMPTDAGPMSGAMWSDNIWFVNGVAASGHMMEPLLTLRQGRSHVIEMTNATAWHHPMHLHGHSFRVVQRNGRATKHREWQDTVLMAPGERVEIAFVADNPGDWMFHCHILEHQASGMMGVFRIA